LDTTIERACWGVARGEVARPREAKSGMRRDLQRARSEPPRKEERVFQATRISAAGRSEGCGRPSSLVRQEARTLKAGKRMPESTRNLVVVIQLARKAVGNVRWSGVKPMPPRLIGSEACCRANEIDWRCTGVRAAKSVAPLTPTALWGSGARHKASPPRICESVSMVRDWCAVIAARASAGATSRAMWVRRVEAQKLLSRAAHCAHGPRPYSARARN